MTHFEIMDYWKDKCITDNGDVQIDFGYPGVDPNLDASRSIGVVEDWGEPRCFACGCMNHPDYIEYYDENNEIDIKKTWNQKKVCSALQKAHIIPKSLGGEMVPSNLFLLCPNCHFESPDTIYPNEFFKWIYWRRHQPRERALWMFRDVAIELAKDGIPMLIDVNEVKNEIGSHATAVSLSSYKAAFRGNALKHYNEVINSVPDNMKSKVIEELKIRANNSLFSVGWGGLDNEEAKTI